MELSGFRTFVRVCEAGSFSKAAVLLGLGQPSITRIVSEMEEELTGPLFYRTGRGVQLTALGEMLLPRAKALLQSADQIATDASGFGKSPVGSVSIAALPSVLQSLAPALYEHVSRYTPGIKLRLSEGFSNQVQRWIAEGQVDIGLLSKYKSFRPRQDDVLFRADLMLVGPANGPDFGKQVPFEELKGLPLVLPAVPNGLRVILEETARRHRIELNVVVEADSLSAQREIVRRCGCYSVMAREAVHSMNTDHFLTGSRIVGKGLERYVVLLTTQQRPLSKAARVVVQAIHHTFGERRQVDSLPALAEGLAGVAIKPPRSPTKASPKRR
jgi:LysR family transcriptional regulator, nitrogen assimilation regulatory protein